MKKLFTVLLTMAMMLSFVACKDQNTPPDDSIIDVNLEILIEQDDSMINTYSLLAVNDAAPFEDADGNPVSDVALNTQGADALINWLLSEEGKELAANFGYDEYGQYLFYLLDDGASSDAEIPQATEETKLIRMSTTTSVNDSGLLGYLIPKFEEAYGYKVEIFSAGTGKAIANAKCGNADLSYDLTQETFLRFIRYFHSYVEKGTFRSYLFRIAMNVINDHFHHMRERDMQPLEEENIRDAVSVSEDIHERMLVEHLLAQLPSYQRDVLVLKYQYGLKAREIACIVNEKVPTVKSRIRQGLARLREIMREEERG